MKEERKWSGKALGDAIGIAQQNASRFVAARSTAGMDRTTANRLATVAGYRDVEHLLLDAGVLAEMKPIPTASVWRDRDVAMSIARKIGYDASLIESVAHRYSAPEFVHKRLRWWVDMIVLENLSRAAAEPDPAPGVRDKPKATAKSTRPPRSGTDG